jgi:hypothetical protein
MGMEWIHVIPHKCGGKASSCGHDNEPFWLPQQAWNLTTYSTTSFSNNNSTPCKFAGLVAAVVVVAASVVVVTTITAYQHNKWKLNGRFPLRTSK